MSEGIKYAVDYYNQYLEKLKRKIDLMNIKNIITLQGDMKNLEFEKEYLDIVWSEGAIYIMGVENGFKKYKKYLKKADIWLYLI
ncbi:hypothetical protein AS160_03745 [Marinitoga sp. 38H-ov]|nr:hypothetical protein AS160_03745 [Marinitoga sp. 38H-ov]